MNTNYGNCGVDRYKLRHFHLSCIHSKLLKRVVRVRLQAFLDSNNMLPVSQSAYRQSHSTETAVVNIYNDLLLAAE